MPSPLQASYTPRDHAILRSLFESRLMTRAHIAAIHFPGHPRMAKKRLQKLAQDGLIGERARRPDEPKLHFLGKRGYELLDQSQGLDGFPRFGYSSFRKRIDVSPLTLAHELAVMDVKAGFFNAANKAPQLTIAQFSTWPLLFRCRVRTASGRMAWLSPDAFVRLREREAGGGVVEQLFYIEVDRSSEALTILQRKASGYLEHFQSGGMAIRFAAKREDYRQFAFRVLWIFRTAERRNNAAELFLTHRPPVLTQAWMTTMEELLADPLGTIWIRPIDYRDALKGTAFDLNVVSREPAYRRQTDREATVERNIQKRALLDDGA